MFSVGRNEILARRTVNQRGFGVRVAGVLLSVVLPALTLLAVGGALFAVPARAQSASSPDFKEFTVPVEYFTLDNGLRVVLSRDTTAAGIVVVVDYNVGGRMETRGRSGFAHLFEHMMFQGSQHLGKSEFADLVQANGGIVNGSTGHDFTTYFTIAPARTLEMVLWAEADRMSAARRALLGVKMGREDLRAGITTVRDVGNSGHNGDVALRDAINAGWVAGPRIFASTRALAPVGGQFPRLAAHAQELVDREYAVVNGAVEARRAVQQAFYDGADLIKVIVNAGPRVLTPREMSAIVDEAHRVGKRVAAHATTPLGTRVAAEAGVNSVEHGYTISDSTLTRMAENGTYLVPTDYPEAFYMAFAPAGMNPEERQQRLEGVRRSVASKAERLMRAVRRGVSIAFGSDEYYDVPGRTRGEASLLALQSYQDAGMAPLEVICTATVNAADLLGQSDRLGTIEAGKRADVIAVEGDVLEDVKALQNVRFVMKGGQVIRNDLAGR